MRISLNWIKRLIDLKKSPEEIAKVLTSAGLEVESIEDNSSKYKNFVVGKILSVEKHPNADRLSICKVQIKRGKNPVPLQIVCGAPNVKKNQKVAVGLVGAIVPKNQHDENGNPFELLKTSIRGIESNGMICSSYELDLGNDADGILILPKNISVGSSLSEYLGSEDVVFELGITPNRADCLSHLGVARELAAGFKKNLKPITKNNFRKISKQLKEKINVEIVDQNLSPRYSALVIKNIEIKDSPKWMQNLLISVGLRPINLIVDVTNFVMMEIGQPLHAFDYDLIAGKKIKIQTAYELEHFFTLDGISRNLSSSDLMICDSQNSIAIAGVMGGENSSITNETKNIVLESAYFSSTSVRRTAKKLGLSTDASQRFERGTDPNITAKALELAAELISEICADAKVGKIVDAYPEKIKRKEIKLRVSKVSKILGVKIETDNLVELLKSIDIEIEQVGNAILKCKVPTYRPDLIQEIDLIEEAARLFGYDNIPNAITSSVTFSEHKTNRNLLNEIRIYLSSNGFNEILTNSFVTDEKAKLFSAIPINVKNPISTDLSSLRSSLIPSMLEIIKFNLNRGNLNLQLFEIGKIYFSGSENLSGKYFQSYIEQNVLLIALTGFASEKNWFSNQRNFDIYDAKGIASNILKKILFDNIELISYDENENGEILISMNGILVGKIFKISDEIVKLYDIKEEVFVFELQLENFEESNQSDKKFKEISRFPKTSRDIAIVVDSSLHQKEIFEKIKSSGGKYLQNVKLFDLFEGESLGKDKKSFAYRLEFQSSEKTLQDKEIENAIAKILNELKKNFNASLRAQ